MTATILLYLWANVLAASDADWPRFRGPTGDGVAHSANLPTQLTPEHVIWKIPVPGRGNGSPVVRDGRIYLQAASTNGAKRLLLCYSLESGELLWQRETAGRGAQTHRKNSLASSTPAVDAQRVVFAIWDGSDYWLHAFSPEGKELWQRRLGPFIGNHGAAHSPVLAGDSVYFVNDHDEGAAVYALDANSGKIRWQKSRPNHKASYSVPNFVTLQGQPCLLVASTAGICAYDPQSGSIRWNWEWQHVKQPLRMCSSPVVVGQQVVAICGDGAGDRHAVALRVDGPKPSIAWQLTRGVPYVPGLIPLDRQLHFVTDQGIAGCLSVDSGKNLWTQRLGGQGNVTASPVLANGCIYGINEDGDLFVWKASDRFELLSKLPLESPVLASPAVAGDRLIVRTRDGLICIGSAGTSGHH